MGCGGGGGGWWQGACHVRALADGGLEVTGDVGGAVCKPS